MPEWTPSLPEPAEKGKPNKEFVRNILKQMGVITSPTTPDPVAVIKRNPGLLPDLLTRAQKEKTITIDDEHNIRSYFGISQETGTDSQENIPETVKKMLTVYEKGDSKTKEYIKSNLGARSHADASFGLEQSTALTGSSMKTAMLNRALRRLGYVGAELTNADTDLFYSQIDKIK